MPRYLPVSLKGNSVAIAVCDRCKMKVRYADLRADGNSPGLRVCKSCWDTKDPWRLPARKTENISLRHARPDEPLEAALIVQWQNNSHQVVNWMNSTFDIVDWKK